MFKNLFIMKRLILLRSIITVVLLGLFSNPAISQDIKAIEVLEEMQERYEESIENIDDYVMEIENHTTFYKKAHKEDGRPYFETKTKGKSRNYGGSVSASNEDLYSQFTSQAKEKVTYEGTDIVEGNEVHVLYVDEMELEENLDQDPRTDNTIKDLYLYIDSDKLIVRKIIYTVEFSNGNGTIREISPIIKKRDFRDVEGMLIPYETITIVEGLAMSEKERQQVKEGLKEFEQMPESQREMAEQMMGDKIEKYRKMLEEDRYEEVAKVEEVRVNTGMELEDF
jgi:hypothetical protein